MTKEEFNKRLKQLSNNLSDISNEVDDIPSTPIEDVYDLLHGSSSGFYDAKGILGKINEAIDELDELANEEIEDEKKEGK